MEFKIVKEFLRKDKHGRYISVLTDEQKLMSFDIPELNKIENKKSNNISGFSPMLSILKILNIERLKSQN